MSLKLLQRIPNQKITEQARDQIKELVLSGVYPSGQRLPSERELVTALGVSRTAVREAMHTLEGLGLITLRHGAGIYCAVKIADQRWCCSRPHTDRRFPLTGPKDA
jgi:GntR family transcriptional repressor for pyruvate dehydrogenase complex